MNLIVHCIIVCINEPIWDGSKITHTRNKAAEQNKGKDSDLAKQNTELITSEQQSLINTGDQQTLHALTRASMDTLEA